MSHKDWLECAAVLNHWLQLRAESLFSHPHFIRDINLVRTKLSRLPPKKEIALKHSCDIINLGYLLYTHQCLQYTEGNVIVPPEIIEVYKEVEKGWIESGIKDNFLVYGEVINIDGTILLRGNITVDIVMDFDYVDGKKGLHMVGNMITYRKATPLVDAERL